jgi:hypothetical protein
MMRDKIWFLNLRMVTYWVYLAGLSIWILSEPHDFWAIGPTLAIIPSGGSLTVSGMTTMFLIVIGLYFAVNATIERFS